MNRKEFIKGSAILGATMVANPISLVSCGMIVGDGSKSRDVIRVLNTTREQVGTLPIIRAFAGDQNDYVSPFVLFDEFGPVDINSGDDPLGVSAHPHAGVTPTTYFMAGSGHHKDSLNYDFQIEKGEFMMFSSGRGAIHMEETGQSLYDAGGLYHGFQIWLNNPAKDKFAAPQTFMHKAEALPVVTGKGYTAKVVLGELFEKKSPAVTFSPAFYYDITIQAESKLTIPVDALHNAFAYVICGKLELKDQKEVNQYQLALFERGKEEIDLYAKEETNLLLLGGLPLNEVVYSYGPFVMNNEEQIRQCITNYNAGKMGDPRLVR
ncbi:MAG: pirin family protein [Bacteroidia bacterium]|nr:pirin family protein [Bacteroidia bacterium]